MGQEKHNTTNVCRVLKAVTMKARLGLTAPTTPPGRRLRRDLLLHHSSALPEVRLDRRCQRGNILILRHCDEWRTVGLAVLIVRFQSVGEISGRVILRLRVGQ